MSSTLNVLSKRAAEARLGAKIGKRGYQILAGASGALFLFSVLAWFFVDHSLGYICLAIALITIMPALWWKHYLSNVPVEPGDRIAADVLALLDPKQEPNPASVWHDLKPHWQTNFLLNHVWLPATVVNDLMTNDAGKLAEAMTIADRLTEQNGLKSVEAGAIIAGLLLSAPHLEELLRRNKMNISDIEAVANWLGRNQAEHENRPKQYFGGIGRDWAFGYTPLLNRFGQNVSLGIVQHGAHFGWLMHSAGVKAVEGAFNNNARAVALIGPDGAGKTTSAYAFAQRLMEGNTVDKLAFHQLIALNATDIISHAQRPGDLENIMLSLANEASHAGHVILFLDNAQAFFNAAPGAFDGSQILLSILEARSVPVILAFTPSDFQRLKGTYPSLATLLTPVTLPDMPEKDVMRVLEDTAVGFENRTHTLITYQALQTAYRLSGRYEQDEAYPGKAIKLLEQSLTHAENNVVSAASVESAVESSRGVKVSTAKPAEADQLLHMEDKIHERMINQSHAVSVVSGALRRARAGVTNPKRPIGSFLFLGPTGVGKTELAKSVAAIYFGSETNMLRLDMSEYQQPDDVQRLLSSGQDGSSGLLLGIRQQPFSVVLLDEIEKAHPNVLNLLLQLLDEGQLTDSTGRSASFRDSVIIATSNAGAQSIREHVGKGEDLDDFSEELTNELIGSGQFKPELLNRFDEIVLFRPLNASELAQVVQLMLVEINETLKQQNITVTLSDAAVEAIVQKGNDPRLGARPMRRALQRVVEDTVAKKILSGEAAPGSEVHLDAPDLTF